MQNKGTGSIFDSPIFKKANNFFNRSNSTTVKLRTNDLESSQIQTEAIIHNPQSPTQSPITHYISPSGNPEQSGDQNKAGEYDNPPALRAGKITHREEIAQINHLLNLTVYEVCAREEYIKYLPIDKNLSEVQKNRRDFVLSHFLSLTNDETDSSRPILDRVRPSEFQKKFGKTDFEYVPFGEFLEEFFILRNLNQRKHISAEDAVRSIVVNIGVRNLRNPQDFFEAVGLDTQGNLTNNSTSNLDDFSSTESGLNVNTTSQAEEKSTKLAEELIAGRAKLKPVKTNEKPFNTSEVDKQLPITNKKENQTIYANSEITADNQLDETPSVPKEDKTPHTPRKVTFSDTEMEQTPALSFQKKPSSTPYSTKKTYDEVYREYFEEMINNGLSFKTANECAKTAALKHATCVEQKSTAPQVGKLGPGSTIQKQKIPTPPISRPPLFPSLAIHNSSQVELESLATQKQLHLSTLAGQIPIFNPSNQSIRFESWLKHFESVMALANIDDDQKIAFLCSRLLDTALETAENIKIMCQGEDHFPVTYKKVRDGLMTHFHGNETRYHFQSELKHSKQKPGETFRDFACRLRRLANLAFPSSDKNLAGTGDGAKFKEDTLITTFIDGIPPVVATWTRRNRYATLDEAIRAAEINAEANKYSSAAAEEHINAVGTFQIRPRSQSPARLTTPTPDFKEMFSELTKAVAESVKNSVREEVNKTLKDTTGKSVSFASGTKPFRSEKQFCDFHGTWGTHSTENCWNRQWQVNLTCYNCNEKGHISRFCPNERKNKGGHQQNAPLRQEN